jgi:hypothetical protein
MSLAARYQRIKNNQKKAVHKIKKLMRFFSGFHKYPFGHHVY